MLRNYLRNFSSTFYQSNYILILISTKCYVKKEINLKINYKLSDTKFWSRSVALTAIV